MKLETIHLLFNTAFVGLDLSSMSAENKTFSFYCLCIQLGVNPSVYCLAKSFTLDTLTNCLGIPPLVIIFYKHF